MAAASATRTLALTKLAPLSSDCGTAPVQAARISATARPQRMLVVRSSKADGPGLRRPGMPPLSTPPPLPQGPATPPAAPAPSPASPSVSASSPVPDVSLASTSGVTIEFQRQKAKELQEYFLDRKYEKQAEEGRIFGWTRKNEIRNGRWTMFGIAVGLLTEYATGSNFIDQLKIIVSNLGIADLD